MQLSIITETGLPNGYAASNYVRLLAAGLAEAGAAVNVLIPWHTDNPGHPLNTSPAGKIDGFCYEYTTGTPIRPANKLTRALQTIRAQFKATAELYRHHQRGDLDAIVYYGNHLENHILYNLVARILGVPFITFLVEWFPSIPQHSLLRKLYDWCFTMLTCMTPDGLIVISSYLEQRTSQHHARFLRHPAIMKIPILANPNAWRCSEGPIHPSPYLLYCANLDGYYHDAEMIIQAFAKLQNQDIHLLLAGHASSATLDKLNALIRQTGTAEQMCIISDYLSEGDLHNLYANATLLLAPLHEDVRSMARFPFKIADYMMSARPVVTSDIGEVTEYLTDGVNAFLCKQDSPEAFAETIKRALNHPNLESIGMNGRQLATNQFDYRSHTKNLLNFIHSLNT